MATVKKLETWRTTFKGSRVQDGSLTAGDFLSAETSVLVSGPAVLGDYEVTNLIPIGLVQNFSVNQGKQIFTYNEIGSSKPFMIPGRTRTSASISRILFDGPSLMNVIHWENGGTDSALIKKVPTAVGAGSADADLPTLPWVDGQTGYNPTDATTGDFFSNLRSSFFNKPIGLGVIMYDNESQPYGGFYLEECYINGHNMSLASQAVVIMENISLFATNIVPISADEIGADVEEVVKDVGNLT